MMMLNHLSSKFTCFILDKRAFYVCFYCDMFLYKVGRYKTGCEYNFRAFIWFICNTRETYMLKL